LLIEPVPDVLDSAGRVHDGKIQGQDHTTVVQRSGVFSNSGMSKELFNVILENSFF
jgi:hypothetical protein